MSLTPWMSTPRVGSEAMRTFGSASSSRPTTSRCWLPPDSVPAGAAGPSATDPIALGDTIEPSAPGVGHDHSAARELRPALLAGDHVGEDGLAEGEALVPSVGGDVREAGAAALGRGPVGDVDAGEPDDSVGGREPDDRLDERSLTGTGHAVHGDDLSAATVRSTSSRRSAPRSSTTVSPDVSRITSPVAAASSTVGASTSAPTIARASEAALGVRLPDRTTPPRRP